jgi:hypothetical protein
VAAHRPGRAAAVAVLCVGAVVDGGYVGEDRVGTASGRNAYYYYYYYYAG